HESLLCIEYGLLALVALLSISAVLLYLNRIYEMRKLSISYQMNGQDSPIGVAVTNASSLDTCEVTKAKLVSAVTLPSYRETLMDASKQPIDGERSEGKCSAVKKTEEAAKGQLELVAIQLEHEVPPPEYDQVVIKF